MLGAGHSLGMWAGLSLEVGLPEFRVYRGEEEAPSLPPSGTVTLAPTFQPSLQSAPFVFSVPIPAEAILWERVPFCFPTHLVANSGFCLQIPYPVHLLHSPPHTPTLHTYRLHTRVSAFTLPRQSSSQQTPDGTCEHSLRLPSPVPLPPCPHCIPPGYHA